MKYIIQDSTKRRIRSRKTGRMQTIDHAKLSGSYFKGTYFGGGGISFGLISEAQRFDTKEEAEKRAKELGLKAFRLQKTFL